MINVNCSTAYFFVRAYSDIKKQLLFQVKQTKKISTCVLKIKLMCIFPKIFNLEMPSVVV